MKSVRLTTSKNFRTFNLHLCSLTRSCSVIYDFYKITNSNFFQLGLRKSDEKQPFPYRNDKITSFNQMANEKGLKGVTNITDKFTDSLTEEEIGSLFKVLKEDKGQTIANIMSVGMEYMMSVLKILQCVQTDQNLNTIDSEFAKMKSITDKLESSNKPNEN